MKTLLAIHSSGRVTRSITRRLSQRFVERWRAHSDDAVVVHRDLTQHPPPVVNEVWIAAAFADPSKLTDDMRAALRRSEALIEELQSADVILLGAPVYNFGMPAQLKAYFDQVVRVGRTFAFEPDAAEQYRPLLASKPVVVFTSAGDGALLPGGESEHMNHLEPHLKTVLGFIGLTDVTFVRVGFDEFGDERLKHSLAAAEAVVDSIAHRLAATSQTELVAS